MAEGIISASATPEPSSDEQARFDAALGNLLDSQFHGTGEDGDGAGSRREVGFAPGANDEDVAGNVDTGPPVEAGGASLSSPAPEPPPPPTGPPPEPAAAEPVAEAPPLEPPPTAEPAPAAAEAPEAPPTATPPPGPPPGPEPADLERIFTAYLGEVPTAEATVQLLNFITEVQALPAERQAIIQRALDGDPSLLQAATAPRAPSAPPPPAAPTPTDPWADDTPPPTDPRVDALQARLDTMEAERQAQQQRQYDEWHRYERDTTKDAAVSFAKAKNLDATDLAILEARCHQLGNYPAMLRNHGNDPAAAYRAALDVAYWADPGFRARELAASAADNAGRDAEDDGRKVLASAVSASSLAGSSPLADPGPKTLDEAKRAAMSELRQVFDYG